MTVVRWFGLLALTASLGCSGGPVGPAGAPGPIGGIGTGSNSSGIVGAWRREIVFIDESGFVHSSATTWRFFSGGSAVRTIVTTNFTLGVADEAVAEANWRLEGTNLIIDFVAPNPGTIVLDFRLEGGTLRLAGQDYLRAQ